MALPRILTRHRCWRFARLVANGVAQASLTVVTALLMKQLFDRLLTENQSMPDLPFIAVELVLILLLGAWLRWRGHVDAERLGQGYVHSVRLHLFRHIIRVGADGVEKFSHGSLMLRFVGDLSAIRNWVSLGLARLAVSGLTVLLALIVLALIEPLISLPVAVAAIGAVLIAVLVGPGLRVRTLEARNQRGRLAALLDDRVANLNVVEAFAQQETEQSRFRRRSRAVRDALVERARLQGLLRSLSATTATLAGLCALVAGGWLTSLGLTTMGSVVAAMTVAGLLAPALQDLGRVYEYWNGYRVARDKQQQLLSVRSDRPAEQKQQAISGITCGRLYLDRAGVKDRVQEFSLAIASGERVCLCGANGSGKSTVLKMMAGLLQPDRGQVLLNGQKLAAMKRMDRARCLAMVSPDLPLIRGSVRLNLTYGTDPGEVSPQRIDEVIRQCGLTVLLDRLPRGLQTRLSDRGAGLSNGERARISLARALLVEPKILLLDEADAHLDTASRVDLTSLLRLFPGTVIYATHNPSIAKRADRIVHLCQGRVSTGSADAASQSGQLQTGIQTWQIAVGA